MDTSRGPTDWRALPAHIPGLTFDRDMSTGQQVAAMLGAATPDDASRLTLLRRAVARLLRGEPLGPLEYLAVQQATIVERAAPGRDGAAPREG
jgi:hypothetical protein